MALSIAEDTNRNSSLLGRLVGLSWAHFLNDGSANYLPGILPAVLIALHLPVGMAGVLMAALLIGQVLQPFMGYIADRIGGRSLITIGLFGSSLGGALLGLSQQVWVFVGLLLLIGLGNAMFHPQALASVRSLAKQRHGLNLSLFLIGGELGRGVWPTAASFVVTQWHLHMLWVFAIPALITIPFITRWAPKLPAKHTKGQRIQWGQHLYPMTMLIGFAGLRSVVTYGLVTFIPLWWHFLGGSPVSGASIITTMLVVGVIGNVGGGHLADRFGRRPMLLLSVIVPMLLMPIIPNSHGAWIWILAGFFGIALFLSASTTVLIGQDIFPENRSLGSGIALGLANGVGAILVSIIGLWVTPTDLTTIFWMLSAVAFVSMLFVLGIPKQLIRSHVK
jgi:FSR family fosmidomycin resistance protein-like MFS transporter